MSPTSCSKSPRLATLIDDNLITESTGAGMRRAALLAERCSGPAPQATDLGQALATLLHFARHGTEWVIAVDAHGKAMASPCTTEVVEREIALVMDCVPPTPTLAVVFDAARGHALLRGGLALGPRHLSALSGISPQQVRLLARGGEFRLPLPARSARKWLRDRGVAV